MCINPHSTTLLSVGSREEICRRYQREFLAQIEGWKPQEYFVYFKVFNLMRRGKRSVDSRSGFAHCFPAKLKMGAKIPQQSNPSGCSLREIPYGHLKTAHQIRRSEPPSF